jgi:hypothetical protein
MKEDIGSGMTYRVILECQSSYVNESEYCYYENKIKNKICHTVGTDPKCNRNIVESLTSKYMTAHFPSLILTLQLKVTGIYEFYGTKPALLV